MIRISMRDPQWAAQKWPLCEEGIDRVRTYGPESLDWLGGTHPADVYWAIVEDETEEVSGGGYDLQPGLVATEVEVGMAWASRWENRYCWTYGLAFFPDSRGKAKGGGYEVGRGITRYLFENTDAESVLTMAYSSNPAAVRYNGLADDGTFKGRPGRRYVGAFRDAGGQGVDLHCFQITKRDWAEASK